MICVHLCSVFGPTLAFQILVPGVDRFFLLFACVLASSVIALVATSMLAVACAQSIGVLYAVAVPFGFAMGILQPIVNAHVVSVLPDSKSGTANALFYAAGDVGFITGPVVWGAVAQATSYQTMFVTAAGVVAVCAVLSLACGFRGKEGVVSEPEYCA